MLIQSTKGNIDAKNVKYLHNEVGNPLVALQKNVKR